jgi:hypothetical protein
MTRTVKSTLATTAMVAILLYLALSAHCRSGAGRPFFVLAFVCLAAGYTVTAGWMAEDAATDDRARRRVLLAARDMVLKEHTLNDLALASRLRMPQEQVTRWVDFGMNTGWLPMDAAEGMPALEMGCVVVDLLKRPFSIHNSSQPALFIDGNVAAREYGSFLVTLPEGPHRMMVMTQHRQKGTGGISRATTSETGHSFFVREGDVIGIQYNPAWAVFSGGKIREYRKETQRPPAPP